jgi:hypothetical protein
VGTEEHRRTRERAEGVTFLGLVRRIARRPPLALKVLFVAGATATIGVAFFEPPWQSAVPAFVGVPLAAWLIRRSR